MDGLTEPMVLMAAFPGALVVCFMVSEWLLTRRHRWGASVFANRVTGGRMRKALSQLCMPAGILLAFFVFFFVLMGFASRGRAQAATAEADLARASAPTQALAIARADVTKAQQRVVALEGELAALRLKYAEDVLALKVQRAEDTMRYAGYMTVLLRKLEGRPRTP